MNAEKKSQISELKRALVQNYIEAKQSGYENKTLAERIDFVAKTMELTRDYCCTLWNIDPQTISLGFDFPSMNRGITNEKTNKVDSSKISYSFFGAMMHKPEVIYKVCLHELRHTYQREHHFSPEAKSHYHNVPAGSNVYHTAWQGSPNEFGADIFGLKTTIGIVKQATQQNPEVVKSCEPETLSALAKSNYLTHLKAMPAAAILGAYFNARATTSWYLGLTPPSNNTNPNQKQNSFLTINEMQYLAKTNPDFFNQTFPIILEKSDNERYINEREIIENYMHSVDYTNVREECANIEATQTEKVFADTTSQPDGAPRTEEDQSGDSQLSEDANNTNLQSNSSSDLPSQQNDSTTNQSVDATQQAEVTATPVAEACITLE